MHRVPAGMMLGALLVASCKSTPPYSDPPAPPPDPPSVNGDRPAVIVNPTAESRAELKRAVSDMLFGADVMLADDALTETSVLIIERKKIQSLESPPLSGRDLGTPERFRLFTTGTQCMLVHETNHARYELPDTECVPEE